MIYEDSTSSFNTLLEKDMSFSVHDRNIQQLPLEIYKVAKGFAPTVISSLFLQCSNNRHTRSQSDFSIPQVNTVYFGQNSIRYCRFSYAGTWELVNLFVGEKNQLATIFVMKTQAENITKSSEVKRQIVHKGQTELNNMLVRKNVLNEINKEGTFTQGFNNCRKIKRKLSQNLDDLQNLLITLTVKISSEKAWLGLLYEFPLSLNPGDKSNDAQA